MKDIEENADFTSKQLLDGLEQKQRAADEAAAQQAEAKKAKEAAKQREKIELDGKRKRVKEKSATVKWYEAKSDDGYSYFWHTETNGKCSLATKLNVELYLSLFFSIILTSFVIKCIH